MNIAPGLPATQAQTNYVQSIQRRLHLPDQLLDNHCVAEFGRPFAALDRAQVSTLLVQMIAWEALPADLQRAMGQRDLPGFGDA